MSIRDLYDKAGLPLADNITDLFPHQLEAVEWALSRTEPYLFVNAPTGSGKTLINTTVGVRSSLPWTYAVHTKMLQRQVAESFQNLPTFIGRANFPCLIGEETHPLQDSVTAADAICAMPGYERGDCDHDSSAKLDNRCPYYVQNFLAMSSRYRVVNYSLLLSYPPLVHETFNRPAWMVPTRLLLCDEAHNIEQAVCDATSLYLSRRTARQLRIKVPSYSDIMDWAAWAKGLGDLTTKQPDRGFATLVKTVLELSLITPSQVGQWMITEDQWGITFQPVWGSPWVTQKLLGHSDAPSAGTLADLRVSRGIVKGLFTSATLMGAEYVAELLGLPDGTWAYLDMPSVFPKANRPVNYAPVAKMNAAAVNDPNARSTMQAAVDQLITYYITAGKPWGIIHAVSNKYRDFLLTESQWRGIMSADVDEHARKVAEKQPSVLVAANLTEGWDGRDDLCRFIIMPKVPFANLGDQRTRLRMQEDGRSFDYHALVAVVQGAGRGVRHAQDYADTWILDGLWSMLYSKRKSWLPNSFREAYHHNVQLPQVQ